MEATVVMQELVGKKYSEIAKHLRIELDQGDCCGYSDCEVLNDLDGKWDLEDAVLVQALKYDYPESYQDRIVVNFLFDLGDQKGLILGYDLTASSGSGWSYGAWVTLYYGDKEVATASF